MACSPSVIIRRRQISIVNIISMLETNLCSWSTNGMVLHSKTAGHHNKGGHSDSDPLARSKSLEDLIQPGCLRLEIADGQSV